ncbi:MAG: hypothetical protein JW881_05345 [Spirochaetales bacterium]|nr:hypothetical protein [Spirochaetales bacterium]
MKHKVTWLFTVVGMILLCSLVSAQETCEKYGIISVAGGEYSLANNVWGADTRQCIRSNGSTGFTVSVSEHNQGSVAAYPSIWKGCHWGDCTSGSGLPRRVSEIGSASYNFSVSSTRPEGDYNVAAECWLSPNEDSSDGYNNGAEIMIVLDYRNMYPAGSQVGTFNGHAVYYASVGWNFVTYVLTGRNSASGNFMDFINDAISRGYAERSWYLHDMEAGFEIMRGGQGLTCNSFSFSVGGGGGGGITTTSTGTTSSTRTTTSTGGSGGGTLGCGTCNWYGTDTPICCNTTSGWGWENNTSCVSLSTCEGAGQTVTGGSGGGTTVTNPPTPVPTNPPTPAPTNPPAQSTNPPAQTNPPSGGGGTLGCGTCNWYGRDYPVCCNTTSGWGWENNMSCISESTCRNAGQTVTGGTGGGSASTTTTSNRISSTTTSTGGSTGGASGCTCDAGCDSRTSISAGFTKNGAGEFCWEASSLGRFINSWNVDVLEINGVDVTNKYTNASSLPAQINGQYYIYYKASLSWAHFEASN